MAFPGTYNFNYYRGDTLSFIVRPKDSSGAQFDLAGYTAIFTIASSRGASPTSSYTGTATVNSTDDIVTCVIPAATGRNLNPDISWVYDVQVTNGTTIYTLLTGSITSTNDITGAV
jgi:hypothetical protein